jgi:molybdate transport system substrate-binding protein
MLTIATDSSSTLRTQIEQGAPADVFLSADQKNPRALVEAGLAAGDAVDFAGNELAIVVPIDNPARVTGPLDLARPGLKIVAAGDEVPVTAYAQEAVLRLSALPGYPTDFAAGYAANVVSNEENVRAVLAKIELGEGDAAIVYRTDALASSGVALIEIPTEAALTATYAGVVVGASPRPEAAHAFLDWLASAKGAAVLAGFGFLPPS